MPRRSRRWLVGGGVVAFFAVFLVWWLRPIAVDPPVAQQSDLSPRAIGEGKLIAWWPDAPEQSSRGFQRTTAAGGDPAQSNIHPVDYTGPQSCRKCHEKNYAGWSRHAHRLMNAVAGPETVLGDFSGRAVLEHQGGRATFSRQDGQYWMRLSRGDVVRSYQITQVIGSRFYQYYVGRLVAGPEPAGHQFYTTDHVLPFGYWLDRREWVPAVHVHREVPELDREDPFAAAGQLRRFAPYASGCNGCHTTFPLADMFTREPLRLAQHAPRQLHWGLAGYLQDARPELWVTRRAPGDFSEGEIQALGLQLSRLDARDFAVTLGISCEACHLGCREHVDDPEVLPTFFPVSRHLVIETTEGKLETGRTRENLNWACGRCHAGSRSEFAAGMGTWNSIEYTDATRGSCYLQLRCVDCHEPHQAIGSKWTRTRSQDEKVCLKCHEGFREKTARQAHTHHQAGSSGDACLDCHMPRINEGLQDVVRTHMIFSPNRADMIEANHPNACNLCHVDKSIGWTRAALGKWYGTSFEDQAIANAYPESEIAVGVGWLKSEMEAVRLVAADALVRQRAVWALPELIDRLDDEFLINRQFVGKGLEELMGIPLSDFGYRFYMSRTERGPAITRVRRALLGLGEADGSP